MWPGLCVVCGITVWYHWYLSPLPPPTQPLSSYYCSELNNSSVSGGTNTIQSVSQESHQPQTLSQSDHEAPQDHPVSGDHCSDKCSVF